MNIELVILCKFKKLEFSRGWVLLPTSNLRFKSVITLMNCEMVMLKM